MKVLVQIRIIPIIQYAAVLSMNIVSMAAMPMGNWIRKYFITGMEMIYLYL